MQNIHFFFLLGHEWAKAAIQIKTLRSGWNNWWM